MEYTLGFFSSKCSLFRNSNLFGSCIIHILYTLGAKIKKNNSGAKRLTTYKNTPRLLRDPKFTREIVGICRAPKDDMRLMERLAARTGYTGNSTKRSIIGGDLKLPYADWNGNTGCNSEIQTFINIWVWENGFTQVVDSPTWGMHCCMFTLSGPEVRSPLAV